MKVNLRTQHAKLLAIAFFAVLPACSSLSTDQVKLQALASGNTQTSGSELIEGYRRWTRVNPVPVLFQSRTATLCAPILTAKQMEMEKGNPHQDKFITVYVNEVGSNAMMIEKQPRFPQGSVIVKEKLPSKDSLSPELLTVMIKREAGYNPEHGDWEYMALDGSAKQVQARGRLENCQGCHMMVKDNGYVYRNYLPSEAWEKLK